MAASGEWLRGKERRLATIESIGAGSLVDVTDSQVEEVVHDCDNYFHRNPYLRWFRPLDQLMSSALGASYFDGSACHLDLVQWATDPVWGKIREPLVRAKLLEADREFLKAQLSREHIRVVLINGRGVLSEIEKKLSVKFRWRNDAESDGKRTRIAAGEAFGTQFIAWTTNLQSSFGVTRGLKAAIAQRVREEASQWM